MKIRIFVAGGTFDKEYDEIQEVLVFKDTHLPEMLKLGRCHVSVDIRTLMMIDSLHMTLTERELIAENCSKAKEDKIVITHGTGTMVETAKVVAEKVKDKTIVFMGAMVPYKASNSDSFFNLGAALAFVQTLPAGVYIAMNSRYFTPDNCKKNTKTGIFEEIK